MELIIFLIAFGLFFGFVACCITGAFVAECSDRWWEREAVRRGLGKYDDKHVFHWKGDDE